MTDQPLLFDASEIAAPELGDAKATEDYPTPRWAVEAMLPIFERVLLGDLVLEPTAGRGVIADVLHAHGIGFEVHANELQQQHVDRWLPDDVPVTCGSWRDFDPFPRAAMVSVVTNPPFSQACDMLEHYWSKGIETIAMLLRTSWCSSERAARFCTEVCQPSRYAIPHRIAFRPPFNDTDSVGYDWFVFRRARRSPTEALVLDPVDIERRRRDFIELYNPGGLYAPKA